MGKYRRLGGPGLGLFLLFLTGGSAAADCAADRIEFRLPDGVASFSVEVADDPAERAQGLMHRTEMADDHGMLFVYREAQQVAFWMKNTPLSLDIIFLNRKGLICSIAAGTTPYSLDNIPSRCAAQTVLEVKAGIAKQAGLKIGAAARHPAIAAPAWACD